MSGKVSSNNRWRWVKCGIAAIVLLAVGGYLWTITTIPARAATYLGAGTKPVEIMRALDFVQISDRHGYSGSMGRHDAKDAALAAINRENILWNEMLFPGFGLFSPSNLYQCLQEFGLTRIKFFEKSAEFATQTLVASRNVHTMFQELDIIDGKRDECLDLVRRISTRSGLPPPRASALAAAPATYGTQQPATAVTKAAPMAPPPAQATARFPPTADLDESDACLGGLKRFIIGHSDAFTASNLEAVKRNCSSKRKEWLCFIEGGHGGQISTAEKNQLEIACDLKDD